METVQTLPESTLAGRFESIGCINRFIDRVDDIETLYTLKTLNSLFNEMIQKKLEADWIALKDHPSIKPLAKRVIRDYLSIKFNRIFQSKCINTCLNDTKKIFDAVPYKTLLILEYFRPTSSDSPDSSEALSTLISQTSTFEAHSSFHTSPVNKICMLIHRLQHAELDEKEIINPNLIPSRFKPYLDYLERRKICSNKLHHFFKNFYFMKITSPRIGHRGCMSECFLVKLNLQALKPTRELPPRMPQLNELILQSINLINPIESLSGMRNLEVLELIACDISWLGDALESLPHLRTIDLSENFLRDFILEKPHKSLRSINLTGNAIATPVIRNQPMLETIHLYGNCLTNCHFLQNLPKLSALTLFLRSISLSNDLKPLVEIDQLKIKGKYSWQSPSSSNPLRQWTCSIDWLLEHNHLTSIINYFDFCDLLQIRQTDQRLYSIVSEITDCMWQNYLKLITQTNYCSEVHGHKQVVRGFLYPLPSHSMELFRYNPDIFMTENVIENISSMHNTYSSCSLSPSLASSRLGLQKIVYFIENYAPHKIHKNEKHRIPLASNDLELIKSYIPGFERDCRQFHSLGKFVHSAKTFSKQPEFSVREAHEWMDSDAKTITKTLINTSLHYTEHLLQLTNLRSLSIVSPEHSPLTIGELPHLEEIKAMGCSLLNLYRLPSLKELAHRGNLSVFCCPNLHSLELDPHSQVAIDDSSHILEFKCGIGEFLSESMLQLISSCANLHSLEFGPYNHLKGRWKPCQLLTLKKLVFTDCPVKDSESQITLDRVISSSPLLETLCVIDTYDLSCLSTLQYLKELELKRIESADVSLPPLPRLERLIVTGGPYSLSVLKGGLKNLKNLTFLQLKGLEVCEEMAMAVCDLPNLTELTIIAGIYPDTLQPRISSRLLDLSKLERFKKLKVNCDIVSGAVPCRWMWSLPQRIEVELNPGVFRDAEALKNRSWWGCAYHYIYHYIFIIE